MITNRAFSVVILILLAVYFTISIVFHPTSTQAINPTLSAKLKEYFETIDSKYKSKPLISAHVSDVITGDSLFEYNKEKLIYPSSGLALLTRLVALKLLGANYRFRTELFVDHLPSEISQPDQHRIDTVGFEPQIKSVGNLYVRGYGDPTLDSKAILDMSLALKYRGIHEIADVVIDDSLFQNPPKAYGDSPVQVGLGALSANQNCYQVLISPSTPGYPAFVNLTPGLNFSLKADVGSRRGVYKRLDVGHGLKNNPVRSLQGSDNSLSNMEQFEVFVRGIIGENSELQLFTRSVPDVSANFAMLLRHALLEARIKVNGSIRKGETPAPAKLIYLRKSEILGNILQSINKAQMNFIFGQLEYVLGQDSTGYFRRELGVKKLARALESFGVDPNSFEIFDGTGVDRRNRINLDHITKILLAGYQDFTISAYFLASFNVSKGDIDNENSGKGAGDISLNLLSSNLYPWVFSTIERDVSFLAGYVEDKTKTRQTFVLSTNGELSVDELLSMQNEFLKLLIGDR